MLKKIIHTIEVEKREIKNRELIDLCKEVGSIFGETMDSHFCHEISEFAVNLLVV